MTFINFKIYAMRSSQSTEFPINDQKITNTPFTENSFRPTFRKPNKPVSTLSNKTENVAKIGKPVLRHLVTFSDEDADISDESSQKFNSKKRKEDSLKDRKKKEKKEKKHVKSQDSSTLISSAIS